MKSSGSGKKKSATKSSATTIGDFFPLKKSTTKNKRNKDEQERSGKKKLKKNESALRTCPICTKDFHWTLIDVHASECVGGGDLIVDDFEKKKSSFSRSSSKEEDKEEKETSFESPEKKKKKMNENDCNTNAFTTLIQNQRLSECQKYLVLSFDEEEKWNVAFEKSVFVDKALFSGATALKEIERGGIKCKTTLTVSINGIDNNRTFIDDEDKNNTTTSIRATYTNHRLSQSVLTSALQKNVRRKRVGPTYRVAKAMTRRNDTFMQCVRRLMIISIEDGTLHPDLPFLAWLMIALSKNFVASTRIKEEVCRIASELAAQEFRDDGTTLVEKEVKEVKNDDSDDDVDVLPSLSSIQEKFGSNSEETLLIASLIVRAQFGGMEGDVKMLKNFIRVWVRRFESIDSLLWMDKIKSNSPRLDSTLLKEMSAHPFVKFDIPLEAIDFHVSDIIEHCVSDISSEEFQNIRKAVINTSFKNEEGDIDLFRARELAQSAMWYCSSGVNEKALWHPKKMEEDESTRKRKQLEPIFKSYAKKACAFAVKAIGERFDLYKQQ
jgi:hypothetical protein|tara:strand:+ start:2204 stop:3856 length:1653 start_codon:yes stop_codon:yes gene_type:complete